MRRRGGLLSALLLVALPWAPACVSAGGTVREPETSFDDRPPPATVSLAVVARDLGLTLVVDPVSRICSLEDPVNRVRLVPASELALVNGALVRLEGPVSRAPEGLLVPESSKDRLRPFLMPVTEPAHPEPAVPPEWAVQAGRTWKYIVIHHSATEAGSAAGFDDYHRRVRRWENGLGYHFVIGNGQGTPDGLVEVGGRWKRQLQGAHAGVSEFNEHGIGICLVGNFEAGRPTHKQLEALHRLVDFLRARYRIPAGGVRMHRDVRQGTACPGTHFPIDQFRKAP